MAATFALACGRLRCSLFLQKRCLPFATNFSLAGNSRLLSYATRNLAPEHQKRKIMVAGLREGQLETDRETLERYFKSYGQIEWAKIVRDQVTGRSKGYGFVTFKSSSVVDKVLASTNHKIDGKDVRVSLAVKPLRKSSEFPAIKDVFSQEVEARKIYVSQLIAGYHGTTERDLKEYFSAFGEVEVAKIVFPKSYGFVTFKNPETVKEVLSISLHFINGWRIKVSRPYKDKVETLRKRKRTINVYNVSPRTSDDELANHFSKFGEVEKVLGRDDDNVNGQCMIVFKREEAAEMAIEQYMQAIASQEKVYVRPLAYNNSSNSILLRGAPADITLEVLQLYFEQFGEIVRMDLTTDHHRPTHVDIHGVKYRICAGWPSVEFQDAHTVRNLLQDNHVICGQEVDVREFDRRAMSGDAWKGESDRSMMVLIDDLDRNVSKENIIDYFASQSLMVQSVVCKMESNDSMSCVIGFWNLDDVDEVVNQASKQDGILFISGKPAYVRRLHWERTQEKVELNTITGESLS